LFLAPLLFCAAAGVPAADSAADYPSRPIRFIVPFVAGGPSDVLSRMLGQKMSETWGQSVIIDNRGSAGGLLGFELVAKAVPDGYTLILANGSRLTINPFVYLKLPYDAQRDFQPITQVTSGAYYMVVPPSVPAKSVSEFIALAKAKPGQLNFAATGTNNLLAAEQFNYMAGIKTTAVNYKGTGQALTAVLSGEGQKVIISPPIRITKGKAGHGAGGRDNGAEAQPRPAGCAAHRGYLTGLREHHLAQRAGPRQDTQAHCREALSGADQDHQAAGCSGTLQLARPRRRGFDAG